MFQAVLGAGNVPTMKCKNGLLGKTFLSVQCNQFHGSEEVMLFRKSFKNQTWCSDDVTGMMALTKRRECYRQDVERTVRASQGL